jgi:hypothetical protein
MKHNLKTLPAFFESTLQGFKTFEIRKDDRDFSIMDVIILDEYNGKDFTGRKQFFRVNYILRNVPEFGLCSGFVLLGLARIYSSSIDDYVMV